MSTRSRAEGSTRGWRRATETQARLFLADCAKFADILGTAVRDFGFSGVARDSSANSIGFANGTRIWSLSSNADAQAGKRGTRVLDEFALHRSRSGSTP